ncbi:acid ceramidase-like isoform X1 [Portunus trituberculatus]|uniref:acid ceramidase-like isoform X1 n=2 Tax=Portunus trituberculatus TaxID=210409 RepID=UPI001E1D1E6C|nr:acid ceramidase-like isoform X1 [Portunus trituberculatus]
MRPTLSTLTVFTLSCAFCLAGASTLRNPFLGCEENAFPPNKSNAVPQYTISLDLVPEDRWTQLITDKKEQMVALVGHVRNLTRMVLGDRVFQIVIDHLEELSSTLPSPYREEMVGISQVSGLPVSEVTLYNIFYEVFTFCTSIIVQDSTGRLYHGRNLDFGLFLGWNPKEHTWQVAELLKPMVVQLEWRRGGELLYQSVSYAGYVGVLTAVKKDKFTFSLDERFSLDGGFMGLLEWVLLKDHKQKWIAFITREVMEQADSYEAAKYTLSHTRLLAPVYFILGGAQRGQGSIITRWRDNFRVDDLGSKVSGSSSWFLVETNYDLWNSPPFYDDRRSPAVRCLNEAGQGNASLSLLYNVLSTRPVMNKLTTYTSLMQVNEGHLEAWLRFCDDPCWPW